jgi:hypothetical protein
VGISGKLVDGPLGFGTAPLGNIFRDIPDHEAAAMLDARVGTWHAFFRHGTDVVGHEPRAARSSTLRPRPTAKLGNYRFTTLSKPRDR